VDNTEIKTPAQAQLIQKIEKYRAPVFVLFVGFMSLGLAQALLSAWVLQGLDALGFTADKTQSVLVESVLGIQIVAFIMSLFFTEFLRSRLGDKLRLSPFEASWSEKIYPITFPDKRLFWDYFFKAFLSTCVWVGLGIFLGVFDSEASLLMLPTGIAAFSLTFASFIFASLVFFLWYYLFFCFREWMIRHFTVLGLSKIATVFLVILVECMLWIPVVGFSADTYSGLPIDLGVYLGLAIGFSVIHGIPHFIHFESRTHRSKTVSQKQFLSQWALLYCLVFIFGCPLGKLNEPSVLKLFPGPLFDQTSWPTLFRLNSTFDGRVFFLVSLIVLASNTLPQVLRFFKKRRSHILANP
jgi:hypothetical protein